MVFTKKDQWSVILSVVIGGILEWYEIFLYVYWAPVIGDLFFSPSYSNFLKTADAFLIFAFGFLSRPLGGFIFGRIGDRFGRRKAFIASIVAISIPSFAIGILPTYASWGVASALLLGIMRFLQGIPAGGELPGAMCYLAESAPKGRLRLFCSFTFIGPQIGGIIGMIEAWLFETTLSKEALVNWGVRASFLAGGLLALLGFFLRRRLKETPLFNDLEKKHMVVRIPLRELFQRYYGKMVLIFAVSIFEVVGYFIVAVFPVAYFDKLFGIETSTNLIITTLLLIFSVCTIPLFGALGDKFNDKFLLTISAIGVVLLSYPFYLAVNHHNLIHTIIIEMLIILFLNIQFALLPSLLAKLIPLPVRFTCLGFSFNACDSVIGGSVTYAALSLIYHTGNPGSFIVLLTVSAIISSIALFFVKENKTLA